MEKTKKERNSYYYYYNTIFFLKDCCILRKDQKPCCLQESQPVCVHEVSSECTHLASSPFPMASIPCIFQVNGERVFTSNPSIVPTGEGDIPTTSHSFLLLWKIKVKNFHQPATAASSEDLLLPPLKKRGKRKHRTEMFLEPPQFMYKFVSLAL